MSRSPVRELYGPEFIMHSLAIPEPFRSWERSAGSAAQANVEAMMICDLVLVGAACTHRIEVEVTREWRVPLNLWALTVQDSGDGKSRAQGLALRPVAGWELQRDEETRRDVARYLSTLATAQLRLKAAQKKLAKGTGSVEEVERLAHEVSDLEASPVVPPRFMCGDVTGPVFAKILAEQGERIMVSSTEGEIFDIMSGRYAANSAPDVEVFVKSFSGDPVLVDRISRQRVSLKRPLSSMLIATQPYALEDLGKRPYMVEKGVLPRFLFYKPRTGKEWPGRPPELDQDADAQRWGALTSLLNLPPMPTPGRLTLEERPLQAFFEMKLHWARRRADGGDLYPVRGWAKRLPEFCAKLCGILHVMGRANDPAPWATPIGHRTFERAFDMLQHFFIPHAQACLLDVQEAPTDRLARRAWDLIVRREWMEFSASQLHRALGGDVKRADVDAAIGVLIEAECLEPIESAPGKGRPKSQWYAVVSEPAFGVDGAEAL